MKLNGALLIVDECLKQHVILTYALRRQGFNATNPSEIWKIPGMADQAIIGLARARGGIVLTNNQKDFNALQCRLNFAFGGSKGPIRVLFTDQTLPPLEVVRRLINFDERMRLNPNLWETSLNIGHGVIKI